MKHTRPQQPAEDALRETSGANLACAEGADVCELLIAELEGRRARLQKLLHSLWLEADGVPASRVPLRPRGKCSHARNTRTA
jgi:hypothetical protein